MAYSNRIEKICELAGKGTTVADIGCDHGYVTIGLLSSGAYKNAIAMDINKGPLATAKRNADQARVSGRVDFRLSNGFGALNKDEADTAVICGMGGLLMRDIISDGFTQCKSLKKLVLGPQSEIGEFRSFLLDNGFYIDKDVFIFDEGKYYQLLVVHYDIDNISECKKRYNEDFYLQYGYEPVVSKNPDLFDYLIRQRQVNQELLVKLESSCSPLKDGILERINELKLIQATISKALEYFD